MVRLRGFPAVAKAVLTVEPWSNRDVGDGGRRSAAEEFGNLRIGQRTAARLGARARKDAAGLDLAPGLS